MNTINPIQPSKSQKVISFLVNLLVSALIVALGLLSNALLLFMGIGAVLHIIFWVSWFSRDEFNRRWTEDVFGYRQGAVALSILISDLALIGWIGSALWLFFQK